MMANIEDVRLVYTASDTQSELMANIEEVSLVYAVSDNGKY